MKDIIHGMRPKVGTSTITVVIDKCTCCRRCQLICSFHHYKEFNLDISRIIITESSQGVEKIIFADECESCGLCAKYCTYGALEVRKRV